MTKGRLRSSLGKTTSPITRKPCGQEDDDRQPLQVLDFAASRCTAACMRTPAVMAALSMIARQRPEAQADLSLFWHALSLRRPAARRHDAMVALQAIKARLENTEAR